MKNKIENENEKEKEERQVRHINPGRCETADLEIIPRQQFLFQVIAFHNALDFSSLKI